MSDSPTPKYDEWVEYCFTQAYADFHAGYELPDRDIIDSRIERFVDLPPDILATYVVELFGSPAFIANRYGNDEIASAIWFLFGPGSGYFYELMSKAVPHDLQIKCISSVATLYTELLDKVCCKHASDPEGDYTDTLKVDVAVYMIWDMGGVECAAMYKKYAHLVAPVFGVLNTILSCCRTSSCLISALHGLGHMRSSHQTRTRQMIDAFLRGRSIPAWMQKYAQAARSGGVQ